MGAKGGALLLVILPRVLGRLLVPRVLGLMSYERPICWVSVQSAGWRCGSAVAQQPALPLAAGDEDLPGEEQEPQWQRALGQPSQTDPYRVVRRVAPLLLFHVLWAAAIVALNEACGHRLCIPGLLHTLLGGVLGLLLAFRTINIRMVLMYVSKVERFGGREARGAAFAG